MHGNRPADRGHFRRLFNLEPCVVGAIYGRDKKQQTESEVIELERKRLCTTTTTIGAFFLGLLFVFPACLWLHERRPEKTEQNKTKQAKPTAAAQGAHLPGPVGVSCLAPKGAWPSDDDRRAKLSFDWWQMLPIGQVRAASIRGGRGRRQARRQGN